MGKNEIRLRRSRFTGRGSDRFRNYGAVVEQHEKEKRLKKIFRAFTFFLIILILVALLFLVNHVERRASPKKRAFTEKLYNSFHLRNVVSRGVQHEMS